MTAPYNRLEQRAEIWKVDGPDYWTESQAMTEIRNALSSRSTKSPSIFAALVHEKRDTSLHANSFATATKILSAYLRGWRTLTHLAKRRPSAPNHLETFRDETEDICIYWGIGSTKDIDAKLVTMPGLYVIPSRLNKAILGGLDLPPLPEPFTKFPLVMYFKMDKHSSTSEWKWNPWESLVQSVNVDEKKDEIQRNTLEWRTRFMKDNECWTSAEVAKESTSTAKNRAAIASRWLAERKIFSVRFEGKTWYPQFQFQDGSPLPAVAKVIEVFPEGSTGWDLAFFFTTVNAFVGRKPMDYLKTDPEKLVSLARSFINPADGF